MNTFIKSVAACSLAAVALTIGAAAAQTDDYPAEPIRMVIPYGPGGAVDTTLRILSDALQQELGQPVVIESRPGGLGVIAMNEVAQAPADGYTFFVGNQSSNLITPLFHTERVSVDYFEEFVPVARLVEFPAVAMVTTNNFDVSSFEEFLEFAKAHPGEVRYTSTGVASFPHFDIEMLALKEGLKMTHVPVTSGAAGIAQSIMNGDVHLAVNNIATSLPIILSGNARPIAVVSPERLEALPEVPTMAELGYEEIGTIQWIGVFGRQGIPEERLQTMVDAFTAALEKPEVIAAFEAQMISVNPTTSIEEARAWFDSEIKSWENIIEVTGITIE